MGSAPSAKWRYPSCPAWQSSLVSAFLILSSPWVHGRAQVDMSLLHWALACTRLHSHFVESPVCCAGLPGNPPSAVDAARDKHAARAAMQVGKLPTPRHALINAAKDLQAAGDHVQFPAGKLAACSSGVCDCCGSVTAGASAVCKKGRKHSQQVTMSQ